MTPWKHRSPSGAERRFLPQYASLARLFESKKQRIATLLVLARGSPRRVTATRNRPRRDVLDGRKERVGALGSPSS